VKLESHPGFEAHVYGNMANVYMDSVLRGFTIAGCLIIAAIIFFFTLKFDLPILLHLAPDHSTNPVNPVYVIFRLTVAIVCVSLARETIKKSKNIQR